MSSTMKIVTIEDKKRFILDQVIKHTKSGRFEWDNGIGYSEIRLMQYDGNQVIGAAVTRRPWGNKIFFIKYSTHSFHVGETAYRNIGSSYCPQFSFWITKEQAKMIKETGDKKADRKREEYDQRENVKYIEFVNALYEALNKEEL